MIRQAYWEVKVDSASIGDFDLGVTAGAAIDTGTSLIVVPTEMAAKINKAIGAKRNWAGQYTIDCSVVPFLPKFTVTMGGYEFTLAGEDYVLAVQDSCVSSFTGMDLETPTGKIWIVGDAFMRKYYTIYDFENHQVGFALSKNQ